MTLQTRINDLLSEKGTKPAHLASAIGATRATVSDWVHGKTKSISPDYLFAAADYFDVCHEWLATGKGGKKPSVKVVKPIITRMLDSNKMPTETEQNEIAQRYAELQSCEMWRGEVASEVRYMSVPASWLLSEGLVAENIKTIEMPDDSQAERIRRGDIVAINVDFGKTLRNDALYAIRLGGVYTLRRVTHQSSGSIVLRCDNPRYADDIVPQKDIAKLDILGVFVRFQGTTG